MEDSNLKFINSLKEKYEPKNYNLIEMLHEVQKEYGYIPLNMQEFISNYLKVELAEIYGVITFYSRFTLKPKAKYSLCVCMGTACYVKGADKLLSYLENLLNIKLGEITDDQLFGIVDARCVGACSLAPIFMVNDKVYGKADEKLIKEVISSIRKES